ncbi:hypothetical protein LZ32DRAFT_613485 [Colletotrichum eremochloae]|nr:hypothetical protein LZ32DRAFT_613485 [Colletotrichum eremochloae]
MFQSPHDLIEPDPRYHERPVIEATTIFISQILHYLATAEQADKTFREHFDKIQETTGFSSGLIQGFGWPFAWLVEATVGPFRKGRKYVRVSLIVRSEGVDRYSNMGKDGRNIFNNINACAAIEDKTHKETVMISLKSKLVETCEPAVRKGSRIGSKGMQGRLSM